MRHFQGRKNNKRENRIQKTVGTVIGQASISLLTEKGESLIMPPPRQKKTDFNEILSRMKQYTNTPFYLKGGKEFRYTIHQNKVWIDNNQYIYLSQFRKGYEQAPVEGPGSFEHIWGPSYVWAVFHDKRIRKNDW